MNQLSLQFCRMAVLTVCGFLGMQRLAIRAADAVEGADTGHNHAHDGHGHDHSHSHGHDSGAHSPDRPRHDGRTIRQLGPCWASTRSSLPPHHCSVAGCPVTSN